MKIRVDNTGHGWMWSEVQRLWVMVRCSCDITSPHCHMPKTMVKVAGKRKIATDDDIIRFEEYQQEVKK